MEKQQLLETLEGIKSLVATSNVSMAMEAIHGNLTCSYQLVTNNTILAAINRILEPHPKEETFNEEFIEETIN